MHGLKKRLYFIVAGYFAFWARFVLRRWRPRIIVITGSSGKTTLLHLVEVQLGGRAIYSHHANSAIGIPLHILGMPPNVTSKPMWLLYLCFAPFHIFRRIPTKQFYVVEADTDRPREGAFLARFLKPEVTIWVSVFRTHVINFDKDVQSGKFDSPEKAIAYDFGNFAAQARKLVLVNGDKKLLTDQLSRVASDVTIQQFSLNAIHDYSLGQTETHFKIGKQQIRLPGLHPKQIGISLQMVSALLAYLNVSESSYAKLSLPPGRSSVFRGKQSTILIDSTYNTGLGATLAMLELFDHFPHHPKWVILGDILEQGSLERAEHENLARGLASYHFDRVILMGTRSQEFMAPILNTEFPEVIFQSFEGPKAVLDYLQTNLKGGEAILFKGAKGLEGVIEELLIDRSDASKLVRRGVTWTKRRQAWGLPR